MDVLEAHPFHVTRDADFSIQELEAEDLLETIEEGVRQRRFGSVVRLMVIATICRSHILEILMSNLEVEDRDVYRMAGPLSMKRSDGGLPARPHGTEGPAVRAGGAPAPGERRGHLRR